MASGMTDWVRIGCATLFVLATVLAFPARAQDAVHLELVSETPPKVDDGVVESGRMELRGEAGRLIYTWDPPPKTIDVSGFEMKASIRGEVTVDPETSGGFHEFGVVVLVSPGLVMTPNPAEALIDVFTGATPTNSVVAKIKLAEGLTEGQMIQIAVGERLGGFYVYTYRVVGGASEEPQIIATISDCPATITISALPSVGCHIAISGFRKNTADPVQVILPSAMDGMGNHGNGLQIVISAGALDVSLMDDPHQWPITLFACPGQQGAAVMCNGTSASPGPLSVPIVVRQDGAKEAQATLTVNAIDRKASAARSTGDGVAVTSSKVEPGPNQLGAEIECPGTIFIGALPSLNCTIVIKGWSRNVDDPITVSLPEAIDEFGNHLNGIQIQTKGTQDWYSWGESYRWNMLVFACPGQAGPAASCMGNATTPGLQSLLIQISQGDAVETMMNPAVLEFNIDARPQP